MVRADGLRTSRLLRRYSRHGDMRAREELIAAFPTAGAKLAGRYVTRASPTRTWSRWRASAC